MLAFFNWYTLFAIIAIVVFYFYRKGSQPNYWDKEAVDRWLKCDDTVSVILLLTIIALITASICRVVSNA